MQHEVYIIVYYPIAFHAAKVDKWKIHDNYTAKNKKIFNQLNHLKCHLQNIKKLIFKIKRHCFQDNSDSREMYCLGYKF